MDVTSLAYTKWECKYHIVFAPKYGNSSADGLDIRLELHWMPERWFFTGKAIDVIFSKKFLAAAER